MSSQPAAVRPRAVLLTPRETADFLRLSEASLASHRYRGSGPPFHRLGNGRTIRYDADEIARWLGMQSEGTTA